MKTVEDIQKWLDDPSNILVRHDLIGGEFILREHIKLSTGVTISVQQSDSHYCSSNSVELYLCPHDNILNDYGDNNEQPYDYVPLAVLAAYINKLENNNE